MKKMILLIVSGLLIACTAGSAMAGIGITGWPANTPYIVKVTPNVNQDISLDFKGITDLNLVHSASVQTWSAGKLDASLSQLPGPANTGIAQANGPAASVLYTPTNADYGCKLTINADKAGSIVVKDYYTGTPVLEVSVVIKTEIPEFPTVALPVAAVLGVLFIFGRKKEGL